MSATRTTAIVTALLVVASVAMLPGAVSATEHLGIETTQGDTGALHVTVNGTDGPIEGATVNVTATDPNETYAGAAEEETGADGTATFGAPDEDVDVTITVTNGSDTLTETRYLFAPSLGIAVTQHEDASATVSVDYALTGAPAAGANVTVSTVDPNASYVDEGTYTADDNGTVSLSAPDETVDLRIDAEADGLTGTTTQTLKNQSAVLGEDAKNFGQVVAEFVALLRGDGSDVPWIGREVATFVTQHNPGNAPDHAGPKEGTGPAAAKGQGAQGGNVTASGGPSAGGPPEHAGKPDHAGGNGGGNGGNDKAKGPKK